MTPPLTFPPLDGLDPDPGPAAAPTPSFTPSDDIDLLVVSGLSPVETDPWQAWLETRLPHALWVRPQDGDWPDVDRWCARIDAALGRRRRRACLALAHGFGALALVRHASHGLRSPDAAILVAPADPARFGHDAASIGHPMPCPATLVALQGGSHPGSPWLQDEGARDWAARWRAVLVDAGAGPPRAPAAWAEGEALLAAHRRALPGHERRAHERTAHRAAGAHAHADRFVGEGEPAS